MIKKYQSSDTFRHMLWITVVYVLSQWFLLVATGMWWDDWDYANKDWDHLLDVFMQSSLPLHAFIDASTWFFPDGFYRVITFLLFYCSSGIVYLILRRIPLFKSEDCMWITLLYVIIPINDARIMWICYGYSLGLFLFWFSFYLTAIWKSMTSRKNKILLRFSAIIIMLISYDTESIMMLTILILFYLYYIDLGTEWDWKEWRNNIINLLRECVRYMDYLLAPIIWYIVSKLLFPGYGEYAGHSYINFADLPGIILRSPYYALCTLKGILNNFYCVLANNIVMFLIIFLTLLICYIVNNNFLKKEMKIENRHINLNNCLGMLVLGTLFFYIGFFPYAVKRDYSLQSTLLHGRDTMLLGIGTAFLLYYGIHFFFRKEVYNVLIVFIIGLGIVHFNSVYLTWQESYYQQLQFQTEIIENEEIMDNNTFLVINSNMAINIANYQSSGNSWTVTGETTRYYMNGVNSLATLFATDNDSIKFNYFSLADYDYSDQTIDGIIFANYKKMSKSTILKQKWNELFDKVEFQKWIEESKDFQYITITPNESENIRSLYLNGELSNEAIYSAYYTQYIID